MSGLRPAGRVESGEAWRVLAADAAGAKWAGVGADLFEGTGEGFDLVFGEVLREVSFDSVSVVAAGIFHRVAAFFGENDEDRAPVVLRANTTDEARLFHPVDDTGEAALAVEDSLGERVHRDAFWRFLELDEDVVPAQRDAGLAFELAVEHVEERERALEVEPPGP